jgi:glutathione S-transferase
VALKLFIGDRNYSSWSLRPWLVLQWSGLEFGEQFISLDQPGYGQGKIQQVLEVSPTGRVPALADNGLNLWDSLAISEYIAELAPDKGLWPQDAGIRALARAVCCEMHSGFTALRTELPMNIRRRREANNISQETQADLARIEEIWTTYRDAQAESGPFLFGTRSIADAFFTPIAARVRTYSIKLNPVASEYCSTLLQEPGFNLWEKRAEEHWEKPFGRANFDTA